MTAPDSFAAPGATAVISHRIRTGQEAAYESRVAELRPFVSTAPGYLDLQWIRPLPGLTTTYTVILRFDTEANLRAWMASPTRTRWIEAMVPLFLEGDAFVVSSGLDFWFAPAAVNVRIPPRWKQFLITWSAIFPLSLGVPFFLKRGMEGLRIPGNPIVMSLAVSGVVVFLMVYVVMPRYTKLVKRWLVA